MLIRKHLWLPAMAAAILAVGLVMPAAYAFNPQPDPPGKLGAGQKTLGGPDTRAIGDPNDRRRILPMKHNTHRRS